LERAVEVSRDEMKDERRELALLQRLAVFQERPDLSQVERRLALARKLQDWVASLQANEDFISLLDDPQDSAAVLVDFRHLGAIADLAFDLPRISLPVHVHAADRLEHGCLVLVLHVRGDGAGNA
jgi:hypothetical protein